MDVKPARIIPVLMLSLLLGCGGRVSPWSPTASSAARSYPITLRASQEIMEGLRIHYVKPVYPQEAAQKHILGDVDLVVVIDSHGAVTAANAIDGDPILAKAAVEAVKQWKYQPYFLNGEPVEMETRVLVRF